MNAAPHAEPSVQRRGPRPVRYQVGGALRRRLRDGVLALAAYGGTIAVLAHGIGGAGKTTHGLDATGVALAACASLPLFWWRRAPLAVFTFTTALSAVVNLLGYSAGPPVGPTIALYLVAESREAATPWTGRTTLTVAGMFSLHIAAFGVGHRQLPEIQIVAGALVWALAWFAGERTRLRRQQLQEFEQRAIRAERDAMQDRRLAVAEERARIARDLHDSAAHAINVIAIQAGAARLWHEQDPHRSRAAIETIEDVAHRTVTEIDQIVHSLREDGDSNGRTSEVEPPPGLAALDSLLAQHRSAGHPVSIATAGTRRQLGAAVDRALYRILQEALTNAARHGTGGATVEVAFGQDALELTVSNRVRDGAPKRPGSNGGHGLVGMRERATLVGGQLEADRINGGFRVHALLPYGGGR